MTKRKRTKGQTAIYKTSLRKLKIRQHNHNSKPVLLCMYSFVVTLLNVHG